MEIEKGLAGVSGGTGDGGSSKRSAAQLLKFLSDDRPEGIYVMATCNDIQSLPPEWVRAERWDGIFFVDLPNEKEQMPILKYYKKVFDCKGKAPNMDGWSGAEIKSLCRISAMMDKDLDEISHFVIPASKTMADKITNLRKWAEGRTIPASTIIKSKKAELKRSMDL